jgi:hypothetical protein
VIAKYFAFQPSELMAMEWEDIADWLDEAVRQTRPDEEDDEQ